MAQLAIKGHPTRGKEVIEILEMLEGVNKYNHIADKEKLYFYICPYTSEIHCGTQTVVNIRRYVVYTIEEFLKKYPFKVGDKVKNARINDFIGRIINARWDDNEEQIIYMVEWDGVTKITLTYFARGLQPYKKETMEEKTYPSYMDYDVKTMKKEILPYFLTVYDSEENKHEIVATDGYEIKEENGKYYAVKKEPQYPKTSEECCDILGRTLPINDDVEGYKWELIMNLQKLLVCRDAYWKIAGEQMGLGKPWEPDWLNVEQDKYVLFTDNNAIVSDCYVLGHNILAFPTKEMRDAFKENFDPDIEFCKELL